MFVRKTGADFSSQELFQFVHTGVLVVVDPPAASKSDDKPIGSDALKLKQNTATGIIILQGDKINNCEKITLVPFSYL